jgi:hypothetical protein
MLRELEALLAEAERVSASLSENLDSATSAGYKFVAGCVPVT